MKLGARILKTGMAVVLSLFVAELLQLPSPVFAAISAVFAIQPSIYRSYLTIIEQFQGNIIGAILAAIFVLLFGNHFLVVGLAAIVLIMISLKMNIEKTLSLALVTLIVIMDAPQEEFITFALLRFATIMLGVLAAFLINMIFMPPKYETKLYTFISDLTSDILKWIRVSNHQAADHVLLKKDIRSIKEKFIKLDQLYLFYKEERTILRKSNQSKLRKLVLYRRMITTGRKALDILKKLHHFENDILQLPENINQRIKEIIDHLANNHEHLLLRYIGKAIQIHENEMKEYENIRKELLTIYADYQQSAPVNELMPHMLQFIASIMDYNENLEKLEILMSSFESFHKAEDTIQINDSE